MFTGFQIILVSVVTVLTLLLVVIGAKIYQILGEFGETLRKINKLLAEDENMNSLLSLLNSDKKKNIKKPKKKKLWLEAERQRFFSRHGKTLN